MSGTKSNFGCRCWLPILVVLCSAQVLTALLASSSSCGVAFGAVFGECGQRSPVRLAKVSAIPNQMNLTLQGCTAHSLCCRMDCWQQKLQHHERVQNMYHVDHKNLTKRKSRQFAKTSACAQINNAPTSVDATRTNGQRLCRFNAATCKTGRQRDVRRRPQRKLIWSRALSGICDRRAARPVGTSRESQLGFCRW